MPSRSPTHATWNNDGPRPTRPALVTFPRAAVSILQQVMQLLSMRASRTIIMDFPGVLHAKISSPSEWATCQLFPSTAFPSLHP